MRTAIGICSASARLSKRRPRSGDEADARHFILKTAVDAACGRQLLGSVGVSTAAHFTRLVKRTFRSIACRSRTWDECARATAVSRFIAPEDTTSLPHSDSRRWSGLKAARAAQLNGLARFRADAAAELRSERQAVAIERVNDQSDRITAGRLVCSMPSRTEPLPGLFFVGMASG